MQLNSHGHDWSLRVNWDDLGKLYAGFIVAWTIILGAGILWLIAKRRLSSIKIRNIGLAIAAVCFLHIYLVGIFLAYTVNGHFPCSAEFWIMNIYLPFGIALFQANTAQLKSITEEQQSLLNLQTDSSQVSTKSPRRCTRSLWSRWRNATALERAYAYIGVGMLVQHQLIITSVIYATSPTLQGDWSSYGHVQFSVGQAKCRRSLEWIPSALWQFFWAWIYGPFMLYKIRNIRDAHYWRLQVILTVSSGLPGTPLWLVTVYLSPVTMKPVNRWWVPQMWLAPGIIVMQAVTIFLPMYEVYKDQFQLRQTLGILQTWEDSRKTDDIRSMSMDLSAISYEKRVVSTHDPAHRKSEMYTMTALDKALAVNPQPLLQFAATQDFTVENVVFLMQVRSWHTEWDIVEAQDTPVSSATRSRLFDMALEIYSSSICKDTAEFPVNVEGHIRSGLNKIFESHLSTKRWSSGSNISNCSTAFDALSLQWKSPNKSMQNVQGQKSNRDSEIMLSSTWPSSSSTYDQMNFDPHPSVRPLGLVSGLGISRGIFDEAEASVKYLVLTNTWQKLVRAHHHF